MPHRSALTVLACLLAGGCYLSHARPVDLAHGPHVRVSGRLSCAIGADARVRCWGLYEGIGGSTHDAGASPTEIAGIEGATALAVSSGHACAVDGAGQVACWGFNAWGQVGAPRDEAAPFRAEPVVIEDLGPARDVATGWMHSCALSIDGRVACWGQDDLSTLPVDVPRSGVGDYSFVPVYLPEHDDVVQVSARGTTTCVRTSEGSVDCWGQNAFGECGVRDTQRVHRIEGVRAIDLFNAGAVTFALDAEGNLHRWGATFELHSAYSATPGDGSVRSAGRLPGVTRLVAADLPRICGLSSDGRLSCTEIEDDGVWVHPDVDTYYDALLGRRFREVAFGTRHACVVTLEGEVACLGGNEIGELGTGARGFRAAADADVVLRGATRVVRGFEFACGLTAEGVYCWGGNLAGAVGSGAPSRRPESAPVRVALDDVTHVDARGRHACAVASGQVFCWGENTHGEVAFAGDEAITAPIGVALPSRAEEVAVAEYAVCARLGGDVYCWGDDDRGLVADPRFDPRMPPTRVALPAPAVSIAAGDRHVCAALATGEVACWGDNHDESIGAPFCGEACLERIRSGDAEHAHVVEVPAIVPGVSGARVVRASALGTCASGPSGTDCWPSGGAAVHRDDGTVFVGDVGLACSASLVCGAFDPAVAVEPIALPPVDGAIDLVFDRSAGCVIDAEGDLRCWGPGGRGQLGNGDGYEVELTPIL